MEKIIVQFDIPNATAQQYDKCWDELRKIGQEHPAGLINHAAGKKGNNWFVVDVWESADAFNKFRETLTPIMERIGIPRTEPVITPVYNEYVGLHLEVYH